MPEIPWWAYILGGGMAIGLILAVTKMITALGKKNGGNGRNAIPEAEWRGRVLEILTGQQKTADAQQKTAETTNKILNKINGSNQRQLRLLLKAENRSINSEKAIRQVGEMYQKQKKKER